MDSLIRRFDCVKDDDLCICEHRGCAFQRDMSKGRIEYGGQYFETFTSPDYTVSECAQAVNRGRLDFIERHLWKGDSILDIGAAACVFVRGAVDRGWKAKGFDIMPQAVARLMEGGLYAEDPAKFKAVTMWDSLEHMEDPGALLRRINKDAFLFVSIPIMPSVYEVRGSKHWKPGEHFFYFTSRGFIDYMALHGFRLLEESPHETEAGRDSIGAFAFKRDLPDYRDHIAAYMEMHATRYYGSSATELHLATVANVVRELHPQSILDYGCGRSDLVAHFWRDGKRRIARYDPAIPAFKNMHAELFDLVLACDVMEHIPMAYVDKVLKQIRLKSQAAVFTISTKPARAKLPDGRNAHVTLLTNSEWQRWISDYFGQVTTLPSASEHELVLLAGPAAEAVRAAA